MSHSAGPEPGFDQDFRPQSYWPRLPSVATLLTQVKGTVRRDLATGLLNGEIRLPAGASPNFVLDESLGDDVLRGWSSGDPSMLGGEFLPDALPEEVEIARISMQSTTGDVVEIRARPVDGQIAYRVVDEYAADFDGGYEITPERSTLPLTLGELIGLIDTARRTGGIAYGVESFNVGLLEGPLWVNLDGGGGALPEGMAELVTVTSAFYTALGSYYDGWLRSWIEDERRQWEDPEDE